LRKHPGYFFGALVLLICYLIFAYTHTLPADSGSVRAGLPLVASSSKTLALITEPEDGIAPVLDTIHAAKHSLDMTMYEFKDMQVAGAIIDAQARGVAVRVLLNGGYFEKHEDTNKEAYDYLQAHGIPTRFTPTYFALTHEKSIVADGSRALIMTFNLVPKYYPTGRDFGVFDTDPADIKAMEDTFQADWSGKKIAKENGDDLVWSPGSEPDMLLVIESARQELDIYNEEMADPRIVDSLISAIGRGVMVNIVMTYQSADKDNLQKLKSAGARLHLFHGQKGEYIHAKAIISDRAYAFIGSENFSYTSLDQNRELGIFISSPEIIGSVFDTFNKDWQAAQAY
jgi:phosphatidylserine/phosphatidylglycerophosphate/cardiolipin synthase-like enzyme